MLQIDSVRYEAPEITDSRWWLEIVVVEIISIPARYIYERLVDKYLHRQEILGERWLQGYLEPVLAFLRGFIG